MHFYHAIFAATSRRGFVSLAAPASSLKGIVVIVIQGVVLRSLFAVKAKVKSQGRILVGQRSNTTIGTFSNGCINLILQKFTRNWTRSGANFGKSDGRLFKFDHLFIYLFIIIYLSDLSNNDRVAPKGIACTKGVSLNIHT